MSFAPTRRPALDGALAISAVCIGLSWYATAGHYLPTHDAIGWHGLYHYFAEVIGEGSFPWWNPYGRGGEPFFPYLQLIGLLQPSYLVAAILQKLVGVPSVVAYSLHYYFQIYVFVLGLFLVLHFVTRDLAASLLFSLLALFGFLPSVLRQNGAILGFMLIPLIHYFFLRFLAETSERWRGIWLFLAVTFTAIGVNSLIPVPMILFYLFFGTGLLVAGRRELIPAIAYLRTRAGRAWLVLSAGVSVLIILPLIALFAEFRLVDELFPIIRLLQHGGEKFPKCYASDLASQVLSARFTGNLVVSLTPLNLAGLFLEPFAGTKSEITVFLGTFGLVSVVMALRRRITPTSATALFMLIATLAIAVNYGGVVHGLPFSLQALLREWLPFLRLTDVVQNYGIFLLYGLTLLGGLGTSHLLKSRAALAITILAPLFFKVLYRERLFDPFSPVGVLTLAACCVAVVAFARAPAPGPVTRRALVCGALGMLGLEMYAFDRFYVARSEVMDRSYYDFLESAGLLASRRVADFQMHREPYAFKDSDHMKRRKSDDLAIPVTFYGRDIMEHRSSAFPNLFRRYIGEPNKWKRYPMWDQLYSTRYYYDYLVNVDPARQLALSGVTCPVLRMVPSDEVLEARSPQDAAAVLNGNPQVTLVLTPMTREADRSAAAEACFANRRVMVAFSDQERYRYRASLALGCPGATAAELQPKVLRYDENSVLISASAPAQGGFLYYADGYSEHWKAYVDGAPVPIRLANLAFKAIALPPGAHRVEFTYDPWLFRYAVWLYLAGLALQVAVIAAFALRTRKSPS